MKNIKKNIILTLGLVAMVGFSSCEDFLESENTTSANQETFFDSDDAVEAAILPMYNYVWNNFNEKAYYSMGDGRSNNLTARWSDYIYPYTNFTENSLSPGLEDAWGSFYSVIAQANYTINNIIDYGTDDISESAKIQAFAEARFMRGIAYWYIASLWGKGIIYENTTELVENPIVPANNQTDIIEFAIRDMEYAAANLSATAPSTGRVTRYAAYGMLSRLYLTMAGLTTSGQYDGSNIKTNFNDGQRNKTYLEYAKKAAKVCIEQGPYSLLDNFGDLFQVSTWNNNSESIFQLQWRDGNTDVIGWGCTNAITAFFSWSTMVGEVTWGNSTYASFDLVNEFQGYYCDPDQEKGTSYEAEFRGKGGNVSPRCHATIATEGDFYEELNKVGGGYIYDETEDGYNDRCCIKKHVVGKLADNGISYQQSSGVNTYMMRLAEVYLNYVEACLEGDQTSDGDAITYFNLVHERAGLSAVKAPITYDLLRHERRMEFVGEGLYWYDILRRSYSYQNDIVTYLNDQCRNYSYKFDDTKGLYLNNTTDENSLGVDKANVGNLLLPISDIDLARNPNLADGATLVAYEFGEREVNPEDLFK